MNETRLGFNRLSAATLQQSSGTNYSAQLGFPTLATSSVGLGYPNVVVAGFDGIGEPTNTPQHRYPNTYQLADTLRVESGLLRRPPPVQIRRGRAPRRPAVLPRRPRARRMAVSGGFSGNPLIDLLHGTPEFAIGVTGDSHSHLSTSGVNFFAQDDFHVSRRLTLNLGLRYEYNSPPVESRTV